MTLQLSVGQHYRYCSYFLFRSIFLFLFSSTRINFQTLCMLSISVRKTFVSFFYGISFTRISLKSVQKVFVWHRQYASAIVVLYAATAHPKLWCTQDSHKILKNCFTRSSYQVESVYGFIYVQRHGIFVLPWFLLHAKTSVNK